MKRLFIIRHGKAEDHDQSDFERSLTKKGKRVSREVAKSLYNDGYQIDNFITSPGFRSLETCIIFADEFGYNVEDIIINSDLYFNVTTNEYQNIFDQCPGSDNIAIVGHNPFLSFLVHHLTGKIVNMIKSGVSVIEFNDGMTEAKLILYKN